MDFYRTGPVVIEAAWLPQSYQVFKTDKNGILEQEFNDRIIVRESIVPVVQEDRCLLSEHAHMRIWKEKDGYWLMEDYAHRGGIKVSPDYKNVQMWVRESESREDIITPLIQLVVECRMIFMGIGILHAACVEKNGKAFAFTGPSGAGKSTKASKWVEELQATWISGDRPAINIHEKLVYGVPWDGKEQIFVNKEYPLQCILEVRKATRTRLRKLSQKQVYELMVHQLMIPLWDTILTKKSFEIIKQIAETVPVYRLFADKTGEAALETYHKLCSDDLLKEKILEKEQTDMKLKSNFEITEIAGEYMAIPTGENIATFGGAVVLNEVSAFLLKHLEEPTEKEELLNLLLDEYDVEKERAEKDLELILKKFMDLGLIE